MKILLEVNDNKAAFFIELIKSLNFVRITDKANTFDLTPSQKAELDKRYAEYYSSPDSFTDWNILSKNIEKQL